jgi:glycosyltransferase involved in cell wall biosynthesis
METLRILVANWRDIRHPDAGGSELYIHNICREFISMGHDVSLYSSRFPNAKRSEEIKGIQVVRCGKRFSVYWSVYRQYLDDRGKYDVVLESINTIPFFMRFYAVQPVVPLIYSINNRWVLIKELGITPVSLVGWLGSSLVPTVYRRGAVVTISEASREELVTAGFDASRVFVARPGVGSDFERLVEIIPESTRPNLRIVYVGRLKKYKGIDTLLEVVALLRCNLQIELLIVGKGNYESHLRRKVAEMDLVNTVRFTGFVTEAQKVAILKSSSVFVCCSLDEGGWTIAGLEALRCGVPLVVTDSQRDLVQEGLTGFIVPPQPKILATRIQTILEGDWKSMSIAAYKQSEGYTWRSTAVAILQALKTAMEL